MDGCGGGFCDFCGDFGGGFCGGFGSFCGDLGFGPPITGRLAGLPLVLVPKTKSVVYKRPQATSMVHDDGGQSLKHQITHDREPEREDVRNRLDAHDFVPRL